MKRETKVVIIGVIRLSIAIGVGIFGLIIGEVGWACIMLLVAIFMGIDSYRSYKDENYVSDDGDDEYSKISRMHGGSRDRYVIHQIIVVRNNDQLTDQEPVP